MTPPETRRLDVAKRLREIAREARDERLTDQLMALADQLDEENDELTRRLTDPRYLIRRGLALLSTPRELDAPRLTIVMLPDDDPDAA